MHSVRPITSLKFLHRDDYTQNGRLGHSNKSEKNIIFESFSANLCFENPFMVSLYYFVCLKRYVTTSFSCVVLFASNLVLRYLEGLNFFFFPVRYYFKSNFHKYWYNFPSKNLFVISIPSVGKNDATALHSMMRNFYQCLSIFF